jgi:hypothetical protein
MLKKAVFALSAVALASAPALAQGALTPANAPLSGEEMGAEGSSGIIIGVLAAAAVIGGVIIASDGEDTAVSR